MQVSIKTDDPRPIYVQIMDEVRRAIVMEILRPDDPLPSVRELASELRVTPRTVAQAYGELERDGIVYMRRGLGTFVAQLGSDRTQRRAMIRGVAERALIEAVRHGFTGEELIEGIREVAESHSTSTAAGHA